MTKVSKWCAVLFCLLFFTGCSVFRIYEDGQKKVKGVPFYTKVGILKQTTVYTRTWLEVDFTLREEKGDKKSNSEEAALLIKEDTASLTDLKKCEEAAKYAAKKGEKLEDIVKAFAGETAIRSISLDDIIKETMIPLTSIHSTQSDGNMEVNIKFNAITENLVSNTTEVTSDVDYENTYYFNGWIPLFASSKAECELAENGTLSKGSVDMDTTALLGQLPVKEYLTAKYVPAAEEVAGEKPASPSKLLATSPPKALEIKISQKGFVYTLTKKYHGEKTPSHKQALKPGDEDSIVRTVLGAETAKKEDKENKATFEGSVSLPKK